MEIRDVADLPAAPYYLWGWDLHRSGWGPFAFPATPNRLDRMELAELDASPMEARCPVIFPIEDPADEPVVRLNMRAMDIVRVVREKRGGPETKPTPEFEAALSARLEPFKGSIVAGVLAMCAFDEFKPTGMYHLFDWWFVRNKIPFAVVQVKHGPDDRWYTEPGLGHVHRDEQGVRFRYLHPLAKFRPGHSLNGDRVGVQNNPYRGRSRRPMVELVEADDGDS